MGRMEELFYELYASSKQHDSRQRYAMIVELRALMKQPIRGSSRSDHFERSGEYRRFGGDDWRFGEDDRRFRDYLMLRSDDDDETWTEHYAVTDDETDSLEEESMPQFQVPVSDLEHGLRIHNASSIVCKDSQYVVGCDELCDHQKSILQVSYVKEVEELSQKSTSGNGEHVAHQLFDQRPLRVTHKEKHMKHLKAWRFKFKPTSKRSKLMDDMFSFVEETALLKEDPKETIWDCARKGFKETMAACGKTRVDQFKLVHATPRPGVYDRPLQTRVWDSGGSLLECIDEESFGDDRPREVIAELNSYTGLTHLDKSDFRRLDGDKIKEWLFKVEEFFSIDFTPMELMVKQASNHFDGDATNWHQSLVQSGQFGQLLTDADYVQQDEFEQVVNHTPFSVVKFGRYKACDALLLLLPSDERFQIKHKWRFRLSHYFSEMKQRMIGRVWKSFGYLMEDMLEEEQKLQGDSEPLLNVPDFAAKICETFDQYIRGKRFVSGDREGESNQATLRFSTWVIEILLNHYMVLLLTPVAYAIQFLGGVGMNKKQLRLSLRNNRVWDPGG